MEEKKGQRYVDLLSDSGFKAVFGDERNKDVVRDFLNVVFDGERVVLDIEHIRGELPGKTVTTKGVRFDLICRDVDGTSFVVEMQRGYKVADFFHRSVYYGAKVYDIQKRIGDDDYYTKPVYVIGIMEHRLAHEAELGSYGVTSRYTLIEKASGIVAPSTISCIFVQLGNFKKSEAECYSNFDRWCYVMKRISNLEALPDDFSREENFGRLFDACEIAMFDQEKRLKYESDMMSELDYRHDMKFARLEGIEEGIEKGLEKGKSEVAKALMESGIEMSVICKCTGLSEEQILAL